ncbi:MFS transporter [bacterium]|nr:MFS transporter [bacterium]
MKLFLQKFFGLKEGEHKVALLMFFQIFLVIAAFTILKAVRDAVFLTNFSVGEIPYLYILLAVVVGFVSTFYGKISEKFNLFKMIFATNLILSAILILLFGLFKLTQNPSLPFVLYIFSGVLGILTTSQFWLFANSIYNPREAKRLFSFIGTGAITGGIFGGQIADQGADFFGTENLLLVCAFLLLVSTFLTFFTSKKIILQPKTQKEKSNKDLPVQLIFKSRYLFFIAGIVFVSVVVSTIVDFQFKVIAKETYQNQDTLTDFFGEFYTAIGIVAFVFQLFFTSPVLKRFGVGFSGLILPFTMLVSSVFILFSTGIWIGIFLKGSEGVFTTSINKSVMELFFMPLSTGIKKKVKTFIEMFVDRFATGIAGFLLLFFVTYLSFSLSQIAFLIIFFIGIWLFLLALTQTEYLKALRKTFYKPEIDSSVELDFDDSASLKLVTETLENGTEKQIIFVLGLVRSAKKTNLVEPIAKLFRSENPEIRFAAISLLAEETNEQIVELVRPLLTEKDPRIVAEAICFLSKNSEKDKNLWKNLLEQNDETLKIASVIYCLKHFDDENLQNLAFEKIIESQTEERVRVEIAKALGNLPQNSPSTKFLVKLIESSNFTVSKEAILSAGKLKNKDFIPILVSKLTNSKLRIFAANSLVNYEDFVVEPLLKTLTNQSENLYLRRNIPFVLRRISSQKVVDELLKVVWQDDSLVDYRIIKALNSIKQKNPNLVFNSQLIEKQIVDKAEYYYKLLLVEKAVGKLSENYRAKKLFGEAVREKLELTYEKIFRLLGLRYNLRDMFLTFNGLKSANKLIRANALEFLDSFLAGENIKQIILPIVNGDEISVQAKLRIGANYFKLGNDYSTPKSAVAKLLKGNDNWLKVLALDVVGELKFRELIEEVNFAAQSQSPKVRETAEIVVRKLESA